MLLSGGDNLHAELATRTRLPGRSPFRGGHQAGPGIEAVSKVWTVREVMTSNVRTVAQDTPAWELIREMSEYHVSALPVIDGNGRLLGIVSEADLLGREKQLGPGAAIPVPARSS